MTKVLKSDVKTFEETVIDITGHGPAEYDFHYFLERLRGEPSYGIADYESESNKNRIEVYDEDGYLNCVFDLIPENDN